MKLKLTVVLSNDVARDLTVSTDVTTTVGELARALVRAGAGFDERLARAALARTEPVTLRGISPGASEYRLLDPGAPIAASGLQSGWRIEPVLEFGRRTAGHRLIEVGAHVQVLAGAHSGSEYSLVAGENIIGRAPSVRVYLTDGDVSRRHLSIVIGGRVVLRDLSSANGTMLLPEEQPIEELVIDRPVDVRLGSAILRISPGPTPPRGMQQLDYRARHTRPPRIAPIFPFTDRELPAPPAPSAPGRIPVIAMLAPMALGAVMFTATRSPMSLMMVAFSPLMMIGSWLDGRIGRGRRLKKDLRRFREALAAEREELRTLREEEISVRQAETPSADEIRDAITARNGLLWAKRPEHRSFLEVRFGGGRLPSRTALTLPPRGDTGLEPWDELRKTAAEFSEVEPVPVLEQLDRAGSIGVAGETDRAASIVRSLVLQLVALHSPGELALACFASPVHRGDWEWLKWLPHADHVTSPIGAAQIADDAEKSIRLLTALEGVIESRAAHRRVVRSHLDRGTRNDAGRGDAVRETPILPVVVVLVLATDLVDQSRLIDLAERGPDAGVHLLWLADRVELLPAACRTFVEAGDARASVEFVRSATVVPLQSLDLIEMPVANALARALSPVEDTGARVLDTSDLPTSVGLCEIHPVDLLGGAEAVVEAWSRANSLTSRWTAGVDREPGRLAAVVGQGVDGPLEIDLRSNGPHALVGGTTGAGKSEFLQSWIMSLAAGISPDRLTFLMVDYKGGAAFAECVDLPHTVGLVTDLSPHLVRRALTSLRAELRHREELLADRRAKDLMTLERRSDPAAPPSLVIVIDEFAALVSEVPEFVDGVIDVAQRGRSLGLHLVLATQRPAGVITDNLRANTNLRVALRMADETDSQDVVGVKDAARFDAETPGRAAVKIGAGRITQFQAGYLGARTTSETAAPDLELRDLPFAEGEPLSVPPEPAAVRPRAKPPRDIERLRDGISRAAALARIVAPRRPWVDELPAVVTLSQMLGSAMLGSAENADEMRDRGASPDAAPVGVRDIPGRQTQEPELLDLERDGSLGIVGTGGSGKTSLLITCAAVFSRNALQHRVEIYAVDAAGGALDAIAPLPTVGAVAPLSDTELVSRVVGKVRDEIATRVPLFRAARAASLSEYRSGAGRELTPRVVLLVDGFSAFRQSTETLSGTDSPFQMLSEILLTGRAVGVHVVLTGERASAIPSSMASNLGRRIVLRQAGTHDYPALGVPADALEEACPGRGVVSGDRDEIQFALTGGTGDLTAQADAVEALAAELRSNGAVPVNRVRNAPRDIALRDLPPAAGGRHVVGIDSRTFEPVGIPGRGLLLVAGPSGGGVSTAAATIAESVERVAGAAGEPVDTLLLTFTHDGLNRSRGWSRAVCGAEQIVEALRTMRLRGAPPMARHRPAVPLIPIGGAPGGGEELCEAPEEFPPAGGRGLIVVERTVEAEGTSAVPELVALAKAARKADVLVVFEFEQGGGGMPWDLFSALKQPTWGLALQPDDAEPQSPFRERFGRVRRGDFPPGRGLAVEGGRVTPVHIARSASCDNLKVRPHRAHI